MVVAAMRVVFGHCPRDQVPAFTVDEVVGNHTEPGLTLHPGIAFVSAAVEPVPPLDHADAALAPGPPFLPIAELTLLLLAFALGALGRAIGDADAFDTHYFRGVLVLG